tara:strand:- start:15 stop:386 length:372 start_codon:yes stop_codon:yes gene_type:complete
MSILNECCICLNNTDDTKLISCNTCINSVCNDCISKIDYDLDIDETDEIIYLKYRCPCCNSVNILKDTHKDYSKIYKDKTTELIMDMLEMKRSFIYVKSQLKQYETMFENKYYEINTDILLTA